MSKFDFTFFINGSARSGTTWVSEMVNYRKDWTYLFEPFRYCRYDGKNFNWKIPNLKPKKSPNKEFLERVLQGKVIKWKKKKRITLPKVRGANKLLIKSIRSYYHLRWIKDMYPSLPIVHILRHPCASSYGRHLRNFGTRLYDETNCEELMSTWFPWVPKELFEGDPSTVDKYVLKWCMNNYFVLKSFKYKEMPIVFYEEFCEHPKTEFAKLFSLANQKYTTRANSRLKVPSIVSSGGSAIKRNGNLLAWWTKFLNDDEKKKSQEIIELFGLDKLYNAYDIRPNIKSLKGIMKNEKEV